MRFDIITIFPEMFEGFRSGGIVNRAVAKGLVEVAVHDLRDFAAGRHRQVDDRPYGGDEGMVFKPEPVFAADEISVGDYVLTGGELAALVVIDAAARFVPGVVGKEESVRHDSFIEGRLDFPHYTRPREFRGMKVPPVLFSGDHAKIDAWRRRKALEKTLERRPDLIAARGLSPEERTIMEPTPKERKKR